MNVLMLGMPLFASMGIAAYAFVLLGGAWCLIRLVRQPDVRILLLWAVLLLVLPFALIVLLLR